MSLYSIFSCVSGVECSLIKSIQLYSKPYPFVAIHTNEFFSFLFLNCFSNAGVSIFPYPPCSTHPHLPPSILSPFGFVHGSFIMFLDNLSPSFPRYSPPTSPMVTITLFFISVSLVIFCLLVCFVDQVPLIQYLRSYGICLSPPGLFHLA